MPELDLIWMSAVIFVPSIFALGLLFFPRGTEEWMRWWCLLGTAVTLVVSLASRPRPESELHNLVYGLTKIPHDPDLPWYKRPAPLAIVVLVALLGLNLLFW